MVCAVVVAAGKAERMGGRDKGMVPLAGKPALLRCLQTFDRCAEIDGICLVTASERLESYRAAAAGWNLTKLIDIVPGGETRGRSVYNGLKALPQECDIVAIQDGARPFTTADTILRSVESARRRGSGVAAIRCRDTIKVAGNEGAVLSTPDRSTLWQVQTPQTFQYDMILGAYENALEHGREGTDDAAIAELMGHEVWLVEGHSDNIKLTTSEDLTMAEAIARRRDGHGVPDIRVGEGYDAHRLVPGRALVMGGVTIPHETGLLGHSDADVLIHAIMDALLGAAAMGDIGGHFPDTDPVYAGISSMTLLKKTADILYREGWMTVNVDATITAQRPKMAPHIPSMREAIAECLGIDTAQVNVKATTTERMGFEGREEGISARAVALIRR